MEDITRSRSKTINYNIELNGFLHFILDAFSEILNHINKDDELTIENIYDHIEWNSAEEKAVLDSIKNSSSIDYLDRIVRQGTFILYKKWIDEKSNYTFINYFMIYYNEYYKYVEEIKRKII